MRVSPESSGRHAVLTATRSAIDDLRYSDRYGHHSRSSIMMSNHTIIRLACFAGLPWRDVRHTCRADADHAHPMEPSVAGGAKIAAGIAHSYGRISLIAVAPESTSDKRHHESDGVRYIIETVTNMRHIWGTAR
jgi:hypothetical protein